jgi:hypothetical protein
MEFPNLVPQNRHPPHSHNVQSPSFEFSNTTFLQKTSPSSDQHIPKRLSTLSKRYRSPPYCIPYGTDLRPSQPQSKIKSSSQPTIPYSAGLEPGEVRLTFGTLDGMNGEDLTELTSHVAPSPESQNLPSITPSVPSLYHNIVPDSPASVIYGHVQEFIPNLSPLKHSSIRELKPMEYPFSVYEPRGRRASLFWYLWSSLNPNSRPVDIYQIALQHGVRVNHRVKVSKLREIFPSNKFVEDSPIPPYVRNPNYREYLLTDSDTQYLNQNYLHAVQNLLSREKARGFIERGGLAWRLALEFGPSDIWTSVFNGPSSSLCRFYDGEFIFDEGDWICEQPLAREKELLIGALYDNGSTDDICTVGKSLFPPIEVFESSMHWNGVWSNENESWFKNLVTRLLEHQLKPKSRYLWGRWARSHIKYIKDEDAALWIDEASAWFK